MVVVPDVADVGVVALDVAADVADAAAELDDVVLDAGVLDEDDVPEVEPPCVELLPDGVMPLCCSACPIAASKPPR